MAAALHEVRNVLWCLGMLRGWQTRPSLLDEANRQLFVTASGRDSMHVPQGDRQPDGYVGQSLALELGRVR